MMEKVSVMIWENILAGFSILTMEVFCKVSNYKQFWFMFPLT